MLAALWVLARGLVCGTFAMASLGKARNLDALAATLSALGVRRARRTLAWTVVGVEGVIAFGMLVGQAVPSASALCGGMLLVFVGASWRAARARIRVPCHCYGADGGVLGARTAGRAVALMPLAVVLGVLHPAVSLVAGLPVVVGSAACTVAGLQLRRRRHAGLSVLARLDAYAPIPINVGQALDGIPPLWTRHGVRTSLRQHMPEGRGLVFCVTPSCDLCREVTAECATARLGGEPRMILLHGSTADVPALLGDTVLDGVPLLVDPHGDVWRRLGNTARPGVVVVREGRVVAGAAVRSLHGALAFCDHVAVPSPTVGVNQPCSP